MLPQPVTIRRPRPTPKGRVVTPESREAVSRLCAGLEPRRDLLIEHLHRLQDGMGGLRKGHLAALAEHLRLSQAEVYEVATFYNMFNTQPVGRVKVAVCTNLPCALRDGAKAGEYLKQKLGIDYNETTPDGQVTLKESECLGACGDAPVLLVNNTRMCSFMSNEKLDALVVEIKAAR